ncbi:MAG TPA: hypothetical protein VJO33_00465 [Gemmatimonadaceae bacterium]|nr:hypothetical protein [Gemmatimonadaceae bacterium]
MDLPELAGIARYQDAARIGFSVDDNVRRLLRFHWVERRLMGILVAHITSEPLWEAKCAFALHQWQSAEHVDSLRKRIAEMRSPVPSLDAPPDSALDTFLDQVDATDTLTSVYGVLYPALADAYRDHIARTNPLADYPTRRILRQALFDIEEAIAWSVARDAGRDRASVQVDDVRAYLAAAGGIAGDSTAEGGDTTRHAPGVRRHDFHPRRDARFHGQYNFEFAPHIVYNMPDVPADERNLALLCKRALEMDVPEMMASFMTERPDQPWEFYRDYSRQLWDEARHAMMGTVALEARGIDWKRDIPLNVSFALRLNLHATPIERQVILYAIEQSLMPGETGKRYEYETAVAAGDALSAHFHDYDWADEVLHARIGRRMLKREGISSDEARERAKEIHEKTWAALEQYRSRDDQYDWWPAFVRKVTGTESGAQTRPALNIFSE